VVEAGGVDHVKGKAVVRQPAEHPSAAPGAEEHLGEKTGLSLLPRHLIADVALSVKSHLLCLGAEKVIQREGDGIRMS